MEGALLAGVGAAILTAVPFVSIGCCLWMLGPACSQFRCIASASRERSLLRAWIELGALAGVFGFMVNAVLTMLSFVLFRSSADFRRAMQEQMEKQMASNPDPKAQAMVQHFMDWMSTPRRALRGPRGAGVACAGRGVYLNHRCRWRTGELPCRAEDGNSDDHWPV